MHIDFNLISFIEPEVGKSLKKPIVVKNVSGAEQRHFYVIHTCAPTSDFTAIKTWLKSQLLLKSFLDNIEKSIKA